MSDTTTTTAPAAIVATMTPHKITLTGRTFTHRAALSRAGGVWDGHKQTWTLLRRPETEALAYRLADTTRQAEGDADTTRQAEGDADTSQAEGDADTSQAVASHTRRRVSRAAQATANTNDADTALLAAMQAYVASQQHATVEQTQTQTQTLDVDRVQPMIDAAVTKALQDVKATRVDIVTNGEMLRQIDGLHHEKMPVLIKCLTAGLNVWLAGPSGSGKTHAAEQAAEALGVSFGLHGAMTMPHELVGFVDASGKYHATPFTRAFRNGGLVLLDELDAGSNEALLALNAALSNNVMCLPDGSVVWRHKDFHCVGGANTHGQGATAEYVGRTKIDAAFLQRFGAKLDWHYDETLERAVAGNDAWVTRVQQARKQAAAAGIKVLITPRASIDGSKLISAGFTPDETAALTYLAGLTPAQAKLLA